MLNREEGRYYTWFTFLLQFCSLDNILFTFSLICRWVGVWVCLCAGLDIVTVCTFVIFLMECWTIYLYNIWWYTLFKIQPKTTHWNVARCFAIHWLLVSLTVVPLSFLLHYSLMFASFHWFHLATCSYHNTPCIHSGASFPTVGTI